jgi:hypothetical protein
MCAVVNKRIMVENNGSSIRERIPSINTKNNSAKFFFGGLQIVRNISHIVSSKEKGLKILMPTFFEVGQATGVHFNQLKSSKSDQRLPINFEEMQRSTVTNLSKSAQYPGPAAITNNTHTPQGRVC